jgi:hypothetical protein
MKPPSLTPLSIDDLGRAAASRDPEDRGRAMQALLIRIRHEPSLGAAALPIFHRVIRFESVGWIASLAARGVEEVQGTIAARPTWLELLERESADIAASAAGSLADPSYLPALMDVLNRRTEPQVRGAAIRALGRIRNDAVFPSIIGLLDDPALRVDVIEALADQGDLRATPHLEPLVEDQTETGELDDRGSPVRIGYLAWNALRRFNEPDLARHYAPDRFRPFAHEPWGDPVPPMLGGPPPFKPRAAAPSAPPAVEPAARRSTPTPSRYIALPSAGAVLRQIPATIKGFRLVALVPMALAVVEVLWTVFLLAMLAEAIRLGEETPLRTQTHLLGVLGLIPGVLGVLAAIVIPLRHRLKALEYVALLVGALACLPLVIVFGKELLRTAD